MSDSSPCPPCCTLQTCDWDTPVRDHPCNVFNFGGYVNIGPYLSDDADPRLGQGGHVTVYAAEHAAAPGEILEFFADVVWDGDRQADEARIEHLTAAQLRELAGSATRAAVELDDLERRPS